MGTSKNYLAYIYLICATALWGGSIIAAKIASIIMLEPIKLSFYRNIIVISDKKFTDNALWFDENNYKFWFLDWTPYGHRTELERVSIYNFGFLIIFTVTSVMTHNNPSDPVTNPRKSYPSES